jgi:GNAT superfamily N-acetyltransferase
VAGYSSEAEQLDRGLRAAFEMLMPLVNQSRMSLRDGYRVLISPRTPFPPFCGVWVDDPAQDAQIACELGAVVEEVEGAGTPCFVQVIEDRCPDVTAAAAALGLTQRQQVVGMVAAPSDIGKAPDTAVSVRRIEKAEDLRLTLDVAAAGFGAPAEAVAVLYTPRLLSAPGMAFYLAEVDGDPVASGVGCTTRDIVGVYSVATSPEHRRRGYGSAVVGQIVADGFAAGAQLAYLQASAMGASVYAKLGFRRVLDWNWLTRPEPG